MRLFLRDIMFYESPKGWSLATQSITESYVSNYRSIAYGNGKFVVINDTGRVLTSPDTLTWTLKEQSIGQQDCKKIVYDGSKFVVMTSSGKIKKSADLSSWSSAQDLSSSFEWIDLVYNGSRYIALSINGYVSVSSDLSSWSTPYLLRISEPSYWLCLAFNNEKVIAFATNLVGGGEAYTSLSTNNGYEWSTPTKNNTITKHFDAVIYTDKFIAISSNVLESTDGDTWVDLGENANLNINGVGGWVSVTKNDTILAALGGNGYISTKRI